MTRQPLAYLSVTVCFLLAGSALADETGVSGVVPVDQEPRHRLVLQDRHVRAFDVRVPPGDRTLYHSHERDSIYIPISGTTNLVNQELGKGPKPLSIKPGDPAFVEHSKASFTHRVSNLSEEEFHVVDIEIIEPMPSTSTIGPLPEGQQSVLENSRVRITRLLIEPGQVFVNSPQVASGNLIVLLSGGRLAIASDSAPEEAIAVIPGKMYRSIDMMLQRIRNEGDERVQLLNVEIK
jgi:hypothetical protein